jgi:glycosyltransferase involved in cell wall biosynthesis
VLITTNSPDPVEFGVPAVPRRELHVVGLGRVHPTKGLLPLLEALSHVKHAVRVRWFGAIGDSAYWQECIASVERLPSQVSFEYGGEARREDIAGILHDSDLMVLLTAGENYGHVIAEALQAGCPVLSTPTTPWTETLRQGGGGLVDDRESAESVAAVLDRWAELGDEDRARSRVAARQAFERFASGQPANIIELGLLAVAREGSAGR